VGADNSPLSEAIRKVNFEDENLLKVASALHFEPPQTLKMTVSNSQKPDDLVDQRPAAHFV